MNYRVMQKLSVEKNVGLHGLSVLPKVEGDALEKKNFIFL